MGSPHTRNVIWQGLLDVGREVRYCDAMTRRYRRHENIIRILLGVSVVGSVAELLELVPFPTIVVASAAIAVIVVWDLAIQPARKAARMEVATRDISQLEVAYRALWDQLYAGMIDDKDALRRSSDIAQKANAVFSHVDISTDKKLNQKCTEDAYKVTESYYSTS